MCVCVSSSVGGIELLSMRGSPLLTSHVAPTLSILGHTVLYQQLASHYLWDSAD